MNTYLYQHTPAIKIPTSPATLHAATTTETKNKVSVRSLDMYQHFNILHLFKSNEKSLLLIFISNKCDLFEHLTNGNSLWWLGKGSK